MIPEVPAHHVHTSALGTRAVNPISEADRIMDANDSLAASDAAAVARLGLLVVVE